MQYSPKLKKAMQEIKPILEKYDCAAAVVLVNQTHSEYMYRIDPTFSCAKLVRDKLTLKNTGHSEAVKKKKAIDTINMFVGLERTQMLLLQYTMAALNLLKTKFNIQDKGGFSSHQGQNN